MGSSPGEAMLIRIFKQTNEFEVWKRTSGGQFKLFKTYKICAYSGGARAQGRRKATARRPRGSTTSPRR